VYLVVETVHVKYNAQHCTGQGEQLQYSELGWTAIKSVLQLKDNIFYRLMFFQDYTLGVTMENNITVIIHAASGTFCFASYKEAVGHLYICYL